MWSDDPVPHNRWDLLDERHPGGRDVSVVVTHYEQPDQLARTLRALGSQTLRPIEIIVGDDGSVPVPTPPETEIPTRVVTQPHRGFRAAAARNRAARICRGEILVFLDADTTPERDFLDALTRRVARSRDVLAVGRRRHATLRGLPVEADPAMAHELPAPSWLSDGYATSRNLLDSDSRSFRYIISAVMACRRDLFCELKGFDERFVGYGGEDWDFGYRAWNNGALLVHEPSAVAWHDGPEWSGRPDRSATVDRQSIRLAALVPEPSVRGAPLPGVIPDVLVDIPAGLDIGRTVRCAHSLLRQDFRDLRIRLGPAVDPAVTELYDGQIQLGPWTEDQLSRARAHLVVWSPLPRRAVGAAMDELIRHDRGRVEIQLGGTGAARLASTRAAARSRRWSDRIPVEQSVELFFGLSQVEVGPPPPPRDDLAGYFSLR